MNRSELKDLAIQFKPFGRSGSQAVWVESAKLKEAAERLRERSGMQFDALENFSVAQVEGALLLTYFLRTSASGREKELAILRATVQPSGADSWVEVPSVQSVWPTVRPFEQEAQELFGIRFIGGTPSRTSLLVEGWSGFPMRKAYLFPSEVFGIPHMRKVASSTPDEFGVDA